MPRDLSTPELLAEIHACAVFPETWPVALARLRDGYGGLVAGRVVLDGTGRVLESPHAPEHARIDSRLPGRAHRPVGTVFTRGPSRRTSAGAPSSGYLLGLVAERGVAETVLVYVTRDAPSGGFSRAERADLARLAPHFRHALTGARRRGEDTLIRRAADALMDRAAVGLVVVDGNLRIVKTNPRAEALMEATRDLGVREGRLNGAVERALGAARRERGDEAGIAMTLPRSNGARPLELLIVPLDADGDGGALVLIGAAEQRPVMMAEILRRLHGLSPAEAELAAGLASGLSLAEFAEETERSIETARKTLKRVFAKTDTGRQGELIQRLLTGPAGLATDLRALH